MMGCAPEGLRHNAPLRSCQFNVISLLAHPSTDLSARPMRLLRIPEPSTIRLVVRGEVRRLPCAAHVIGHHCQLVSRNGHVFKCWPCLAEEIAHSVRGNNYVLDSEIVCLGADGCSRFRDLCSAGGWPYFLAFDALSVDGQDLRALPLVERKRRLARIIAARRVASDAA